jgi:tetratricopeptide (TPR) repeat protein
MHEGKSVLAMACWEKCYQLECDPEILVNLGATARLTNQVDLSRSILTKLLGIRPDDVKALANLCGGYVNEGEPWKGIPYGERCVALDPDAKQGRFNLGLLYLENGQFAEGFDHYANGFHRNRTKKTYDPDPPELTPEMHQKFLGYRSKPRLLVLEEQGIGDCIMFSTMFREVSKDYDIVLDAHPRLESIYRRSNFSNAVTIHNTRKVEAPEWSHNADAKCLAGDLGRFYRRSKESFAWSGALFSPDPHTVKGIRSHLEKIAKGRPIIGLATRGGTPSTNRKYRGVKIEMLSDLLKQDALFVSLDYEDVSEEIDYVRSLRADIFWCPAILWHFDYLHTAELVAATDRVITVCQSVAHLSASMGHRVDVLVPSKPAWRYGANKSEEWYWYPHKNARLLRQQGNDWTPAFSRLYEAQESGLNSSGLLEVSNG